MTTHLFAPPGDWPAALCGRFQPWDDQDHAVYGRDFHRVTCEACLAKLELPPRPVGTITPREFDTAYIIVCCVVACASLLLFGLAMMP